MRSDGSLTMGILGFKEIRVVLCTPECKHLNAYLIPLPPHQQYTENIQHLQLVHYLMHDLHGLWQLGSC